MANNGKFSNQSAKPAKKKGNSARIVLIVLIVLLSLLLAVLVGGVVYVEKVLGGIGSFDTDSTMSSEELAALLASENYAESFEGTLGTEPENWNLIQGNEEVFGHSEEIINILLIGQDTRNAAQKGLADSLILCSINTQTKKLVLTSFLRDLWVQIPSTKGDYTYGERINTAYPVGGLEVLDETLKLNFGVAVDHNIEIDFAGFQEVVDALGGVEIELTAAEAKHMNDQYGWGSRLSAGVRNLTGEEALAYARIRAIDNDFNRSNRQRIVLEKLFEKVKNMSLTEANKLVNAFIPLITTDMTNSEIINYVVELMPLLPELEIITQRIPAGEATTDGYYQWGNKGTEEDPKYVIIPILEKNRELLRNTIGVESEAAE